MVVLDTDVIIELSSGNEAVIERIKKLRQIEVLSTTVLNAEEFLLGLYYLGQEAKILKGKELLRRLKMYSYTQRELDSIVRIKAGLKKQGKTIGKYDECIAGICIAKNEALYTLNKKHFERIKELKLV